MHADHGSATFMQRRSLKEFETGDERVKENDVTKDLFQLI